MALNLTRLRQLHRVIAPLMVFPLLLTVATGLWFQIAIINENTDDFLWLLDWHRGKFGRINLEGIYPFLNGVGLLTLLITGVLMWLRLPQRSPKS